MLPPSFEVLEQRLRGRSKDTEAAMQRRLATARAEVAAFVEYDYVIVNDELDACVERLRAIVLAERARLRSDAAEAEQIVATFLERTDSDRSDRQSRTRSSSSTVAGARARQLLRGCTPRTDGQREAGAAGAEGSEGRQGRTKVAVEPTCELGPWL